jgi:hypothetical protein
MSGDPRECRLHALECWREAELAHYPQARETLEQFAKVWLELAAAYEREHALLDTWGEKQFPSLGKVTANLSAKPSVIMGKSVR